MILHIAWIAFALIGAIVFPGGPRVFCFGVVLYAIANAIELSLHR